MTSHRESLDEEDSFGRMVNEAFVAAVENDNVEEVREYLSLITKEEALTARLETGDAVLHRAAGSPKVLQYLVDLGADVNVTTSNWHGLRDDDDDEEDDDGKDSDGEKNFVDAKLSTLHLSAASGHAECVRVLVKVPGVNVNARDGEGSTPLHLASTSGHLDCVLSLLAHGADCGTPDHWGNTALHEAAWNGEIECCLALLAAGCDLNKPGNERKSAADMAEGDGYMECASLLRNLEGCWNTGLVAQLMLDLRQMSKREKKLTNLLHEQIQKVQAMEGNLLQTTTTLENECEFTSRLEKELKEGLNTAKSSGQQVEKKLGLNEDKVTLTLGRVAACERDVKTVEDRVDELHRLWEQSASTQPESTILESLSELQVKFGAMMEKLGDKLSHLEKKIHTVEQTVLSRANVRDVGGDDGEDRHGLVGKSKKKPKRRPQHVHASNYHDEDDEDSGSLVKVVDSPSSLRSPPKSCLDSGLGDPYAYPTPGSSVSADTPSPQVGECEVDGYHNSSWKSTLAKETQTAAAASPPAVDHRGSAAVAEVKLRHLEFIATAGNEKFSEAIGSCVETVGKLKDSLRLVTDQTRPSASQIKAALDQWTKSLEDLMDQQANFHESIRKWKESLSSEDHIDFPEVPVISPLPNAPEVDLRVIAEQLASLHLAAKHRVVN